MPKTLVRTLSQVKPKHAKQNRANQDNQGKHANRQKQRKICLVSTPVRGFKGIDIATTTIIVKIIVYTH